jgi:hypothetical protein
MPRVFHAAATACSRSGTRSEYSTCRGGPLFTGVRRIAVSTALLLPLCYHRTAGQGVVQNVVGAREDPQDRNALSIVCTKPIAPAELSRILLMYCAKARTTQRSDALHSRILTAADNRESKIPLILLIDDDADAREMYPIPHAPRIQGSRGGRRRRRLTLSATISHA